MRFSKVSVDGMIKIFENENAILKQEQEQERLKTAIKDLMDENYELLENIEFLRDEVQALKYENHLTSIISCLGTVKSFLKSKI
jgi:predicted RNase H-like nuclease (RuvC/YqgF family)